ncbi:MAG TPA: hypothetical protein VFD15_05320, partial [Clostridia bacterium]|nr:hypothetical protein [Clostridia bacterium]
VIILTGILFDILGTAATAATETPFHAKAAKKVKGARQSIYLVSNADKVANFANDVIGDIAGTVSGALGISLVIYITTRIESLDQLTMTILVTATIAALTVGGKAFGKKTAVTHANEIIFLAGKVLFRVEQFTGARIFGNNVKTKRTKKEKR